jgi:multidrug resistance efflux pump
MPDVEELDRLRIAYEQALATYEGISSALNRHMLLRTQPSAAELQREREARAQLDQARRCYFDAWLLP